MIVQRQNSAYDRTGSFLEMERRPASLWKGSGALEYRQTHVAGGETMWGSAPRPGRGIIPLHPVIGASPQGFKCLWAFLCFGLAFPFGATPQAPRELLGVEPPSAGNEAPEKRRQYPPSTLRNCSTNWATPSHGAPFRCVLFSCSGPGPSRGVLGRSPKWERRAKAEKTDQTLYPLGRSPNNGVQGTCPLPGFGVEPQRPQAFLNSLTPRFPSQESGSRLCVIGREKWKEAFYLICSATWALMFSTYLSQPASASLVLRVSMPSS